MIFDLNYPAYSRNETIIQAGQRFKRALCETASHDAEAINDQFIDGSVCEFTRLSAEGRNLIILRLSGEYDLIITKGAGWLFHSRSSDRLNCWMPVQPMARIYDKFGRILIEKHLKFEKFEALKHKAHIFFRLNGSPEAMEFVIWRFASNSVLFEELSSLSEMEQKGFFLWGSHTSYRGPKDVYKNLIHGSVYKNGWRWPKSLWTSAYCEADAHALYVVLHSMWKTTGKQIYQHLKTQLVFSVIARQEENGAWRHGLWTDDFEVQYRLHCSGIHLLAAFYQETKDEFVAVSLQKAVNYIRNQCDELSVGKWYLHDSLELSISDMQHSPLTYRYSRTLGKAPSNMLVLNTHLDALVALSRYEEVAGKSFQDNEVASGVNAAIAVMELKSAEILYRLYFKAIDLTFLPIKIAQKLPLPLRAVRRIARTKLIPLLPRVKKIFPRFVMPNGYVDRALCLDEFTYNYFPINVMDLLRFQLRFDIKAFDPIIDNAIGYMRNMKYERWMEGDVKYALGFWAEAMYLYCLRWPDRSRQALAEAVLNLFLTGQGLPPSLLGCNPEYVPFKDQIPCVEMENSEVVVINLSMSPHLEFLFVNTSDVPQTATIPEQQHVWNMFDQENKPISEEHELTLRSHGWVRLLSHAKY